MNDSLKLDMFFPGKLLSFTSFDHNDSSIHIKMRSKTHSSKCPSVVRKPKPVMGHIYAKFRICRFWEKQHDFI